MVEISTNMLRRGRYSILLWLGDQYQDYCHLPGALFEVGAGIEFWQAAAKNIGSLKLPTVWAYQTTGDAP